MDLGIIRPINIDVEMQASYLDYAMSVIVARALPDVRDGLKPVHRRILYAMHDLGLDPDKPYKKSARIVGEVLGKYHPHGDVAVYEAMVRMAQDFSLRYPLVDGQGNFGSVDGDNAAAMRYTEARLAPIAVEMLSDIEKDTVEWTDNFDGTLKEPSVLPAALPNLVVNGASGIAVGMSTSIPPHNLGEVCDALCYVIDNYKRAEEVPVEELMRFIPGPDFPTGGLIYRYQHENGADGEEQVDVIARAYASGKGRIVVQAKAHIEEMSRNRSRIVVTELPYQTNKSNLMERIAELVRDGRLEGITDLRDESDRTGMRICIETTRTVSRDVLRELYKLTPLQSTFSISLLALVEGQPLLLSLKRLLLHFLEHRQEVIKRRSEYDLKKARQRAHILEGLLRALDVLDQVIALIRGSRTADAAKQGLMKEFEFTELQAQAILDMQLRRLAALERKKLQDEYKEVLALIKELEELLASPRRSSR
jgi:DNA gyrase subunit A